MRLGCNSRFKGVVVYSLIASSLFITAPRPVNANPVLIGIGEIIAGVIERRAAALAVEEAADAAFTERVANASILTAEQSAAADALLVPETSALRTAGKVTWASLNVASAAYTTKELVDMFDNKELAVATDGVALGDGTYKVDINGHISIVNFQPTVDNPAILFGDSTAPAPSNPETDPNSIPREAVIQNWKLTGQETFPVPEGVSVGLNQPNNKALYTFDTQTTSGDQYYVETDYLSSIENGLILAAMRDLETSPLYKPSTTSVKGDNTSFSYVIQEYSVDLLDFLPNEGAVYPDGTPLAGEISYFETDVPFTVHKRRISNDYQPCQSVTVTETDGSVSRKRMCTPPTEADYVTTDSRITQGEMVTLNSAYTGDFIKNKNPPVDTSIKSIDATELASLLANSKLDPQVVADYITELLYEAASKQGYAGIPFTDSDEVTASEVSDVVKSLGGTLTAASLFSSAVDDSGNVVINKSTTNNNNTTNNNTNSDIGTDPNVKQPELEDTPTGSQILEPIEGSLPFLKDFQLKGRDAVCPVAKFNVFDHDYVIDTHCTLIEENRKLIQLFAVLIWGFVCLRIILRA